MKICNTHLLLVIDQERAVIGMITTEDILGEKPLKVSQQRFIKHTEVLVRMVMTPQNKIPVIDTAELQFAKVGDVIETLHHLKQHDALVIENDADTGKQIVRGLFSLSQISKQLSEDVTFDLSQAQSILEMKTS